MFHLLLLVYVMILDKIYFWKISTEDDIEKINYLGRQLGSAGAFRPDLWHHRMMQCWIESILVFQVCFGENVLVWNSNRYNFWMDRSF